MHKNEHLQARGIPVNGAWELGKDLSCGIAELKLRHDDVIDRAPMRGWLLMPNFAVFSSALTGSGKIELLPQPLGSARTAT